MVWSKVRWRELAALAVLRDLREYRDPVSAEELERFAAIDGDADVARRPQLA
jgi:hypothetical protein